VFGTYDDQDRLLTYGNASYGYTASGSLKFKTENGDTTFYNYDLLGNLISVNLPDGTFMEYIIDGQNRRVGKIVNGEFKKGWIYQDQINPIAEIDSLGNISARFVYGTKGHVPDYVVKEGMIYSLITDHLGSVRLVVDATGNVVQSISYDEFGNIIDDRSGSGDPPQAGFQPFGYAGGLVDEQIGLVRFGTRDYDAKIGRWTAKDPIGFWGEEVNVYSYCLNDPINRTDPFGLQTWPGRGRVTSSFGYRTNPIPGFHYGIDIENPVGGSVVASHSGVVIAVNTSPTGANQILIRHEDGSISGYAHVTASVKVGQQVSEGEMIGMTDLSGRSTGGHVHYTYRPAEGQSRIDPLTILPKENNYPLKNSVCK